MNTIEITEEYITLGQVLKLANLVNSGAEAKHVILEGNVLVNEEVETRRGKKIRNGDVVEIKDGHKIIVKRKA